eukprot:CFRG7031T1
MIGDNDKYLKSVLSKMPFSKRMWYEQDWTRRGYLSSMDDNKYDSNWEVCKDLNVKHALQADWNGRRQYNNKHEPQSKWISEGRSPRISQTYEGSDADSFIMFEME